MGLYVAQSILRTIIIPSPVKRLRKWMCLRNWRKRRDAEEIERRLDYYCHPWESPIPMPASLRRIDKIRLGASHSAYWFDMMRYLKAFPGKNKVDFIDGDTHVNPDGLVIGKARRLDSKSCNVALMNLDRRRHFLKVSDPIPFHEKKPILFFRGDVDAKENRRDFLSSWYAHPLFDLGDTSTRTITQWHTPRIGIEEHFKYRYILALEGHDVASALQWICASNCIPVMTRPTVESWLMHGLMKPGVHYIEIAQDFSDAAEKIEYYNAHPDEAEAISRASREWIGQFADRHRENILHYLVADRYLHLINSYAGSKGYEDMS